jgi:hypothetical protein
VTQTVDAETIVEALRRLYEGPADERMPLGDIIFRLDTRAHALALLLLSAPNLTPGPSLPGFSTIFGLPLCFVAAEMALGQGRLRLPRILAQIQIPLGRVAATVNRIEPLVIRIERVLKPRGWVVTGTAARRLLGAVCFILGILLTLPIPVFSLLPATAIVAIALGLLSRDGWVVAGGLVLGVASVAVFIGLALAAAALFGDG